MVSIRILGNTVVTARLLAFAVPVAAQEPLEGRWTAEARLGADAMTLLLDVERRDGEWLGRAGR